MTAPLHLLVTGANGYVGRHVAARALADGHRVRVTLRDPAQADGLSRAVGANPGRFSAVTADLMHAEGWASAMVGIDAVLHTASPVPTSRPRADDDVIRPALEGTVRVMTAAIAAGVGRLVVTSSIAAILSPRGKGPGEMFGADDWTDATDPNVRAYARAKTLAEAEARRIAAMAPATTLATVNPGYVFGAPLGGKVTSSLTLVDMLLRGRPPVLPRLAFPSVSVHDVADAHLAALAASPGARIVASGRTLWLREIAETVRNAVPLARVPRHTAPDWAVRLACRLSPTLRMIASDVGRPKYTDPATCEALLRRPLADPLGAVAETARALAAPGGRPE